VRYTRRLKCVHFPHFSTFCLIRYQCCPDDSRRVCPPRLVAICNGCLITSTVRRRVVVVPRGVSSFAIQNRCMPVWSTRSPLRYYSPFHLLPCSRCVSTVCLQLQPHILQLWLPHLPWSRERRRSSYIPFSRLLSGFYILSLNTCATRVHANPYKARPPATTAGGGFVFIGGWVWIWFRARNQLCREFNETDWVRVLC